MAQQALSDALSRSQTMADFTLERLEELVETINLVYPQPQEGGADAGAFTSVQSGPALQFAPDVQPPGKQEAPKAEAPKITAGPSKHEILTDKLTFVFGLVNIMLTSFLLSRPRAFILLFVVKSIVLLGARTWHYYTKKWHLYMLEFCYLVISLGLVQATLAPLSPAFHKLMFALMVGVLTPAVVATRNAFVLHSIDKITSLFQHLTPALVAWLLRWLPEQALPGYSSLPAEQRMEFERASFVELTLAPMAVWLAWACAYYLLVFVAMESKVAQGYATMFALQTKNPRAPAARFILGFKTKRAQYLVYLAFHGACCLVGCLANNLWYRSRAAHSLFVLGVLLASMWRGASYYFEVFAKRYYQQGAPPTGQGRDTAAAKVE